MSRNYPRFLFSNPQNSKSKGPFVISTVPPLIICKVHPANSKEVDINSPFIEQYGLFSLEFLKTLASKKDGNGFDYEIQDTRRDMGMWLYKKKQSGEINNNAF